MTLKAFAKINLGLSVLGRRADGYHELRTVYQSVSLADAVTVEFGRRSGAIRLETSGYAVPAGRGNLAVRAAEALRKELGWRREVVLRLAKRIPPGSGLGGASSDAAAVLRALAALSGRSLPRERLLHLAASLGSDVPFFLIGGRAVGVGRGEEIYPLPEGPRRFLVILFPGEAMSTAEAYRLLRRPRLTRSRPQPTIEMFCGKVAQSEAPGNDFEPVLLRRIPQLAAAKRILLQCGAETASLSGSGSAFFGMFQDATAARQAAAVLRASGMPLRVWLARTVPRRECARFGAAVCSC